MPPKRDVGKNTRLNSATSAPKTPACSDDKNVQAQMNVEEDDRSDSDEDDATKSMTQGFSPCGKTKKQRFVCGGGIKACGTRITTKDDSVMCDVCKEWFHPGCQGLSTEAFRALSRHSQDFLWLCMSCKPNLMSVLQVGKGIKMQLEMAEKNIIQALNETKVNEKCEKIYRVESTTWRQGCTVRSRKNKKR